jgi:hypothetical protein
MRLPCRGYKGGYGVRTHVSASRPLDNAETAATATLRRDSSPGELGSEIAGLPEGHDYACFSRLVEDYACPLLAAGFPTERPYPTAPAAGRQGLCLSFSFLFLPFVTPSPKRKARLTQQEMQW